jgi:hypothetical protein
MEGFIKIPHKPARKLLTDQKVKGEEFKVLFFDSEHLRGHLSRIQLWHDSNVAISDSIFDKEKNQDIKNHSLPSIDAMDALSQSLKLKEYINQETDLLDRLSNILEHYKYVPAVPWASQVSKRLRDKKLIVILICLAIAGWWIFENIIKGNSESGTNFYSITNNTNTTIPVQPTLQEKKTFSVKGMRLDSADIHQIEALSGLSYTISNSNILVEITYDKGAFMKVPDSDEYYKYLGSNVILLINSRKYDQLGSPKISIQSSIPQTKDLLQVEINRQFQSIVSSNKKTLIEKVAKCLSSKP